MNKILLVGIGGFIGAILRYAVSGTVQHVTQSIVFPYGTLVVNMIGCFFIGGLYYLVEIQAGLTAEVRLLLMVGLLGSFTTYSTFGNETLNLFQDQRILLGMLNIGLHIIIGLVAVLIGRYASMALWR